MVRAGWCRALSGVTRVPNGPFYLAEAQWPVHTIKTSEGTLVYNLGRFLKVCGPLILELRRLVWRHLLAAAM